LKKIDKIDKEGGSMKKKKSLLHYISIALVGFLMALVIALFSTWEILLLIPIICIWLKLRPTTSLLLILVAIVLIFRFSELSWSARWLSCILIAIFTGLYFRAIHNLSKLKVQYTLIREALQNIGDFATTLHRYPNLFVDNAAVVRVDLSANKPLEFVSGLLGREGDQWDKKIFTDWVYKTIYAIGPCIYHSSMMSDNCERDQAWIMFPIIQYSNCLQYPDPGAKKCVGVLAVKGREKKICKYSEIFQGLADDLVKAIIIAK